MRTLVWFRGKDLRIADHAPLFEACQDGEVVTLFVLDPYFFSEEGAARLPHRMQYLLDSLASLQKNIGERGGELLLARGKSTEIVPRLAKQFKVDEVRAHRWSEPVGRLRDATVAGDLHVPFRLYEGETLLPPRSVRTQSNAPFSVFTPFSRRARALLGDLAVLQAPRSIPAVPRDIERRGLLGTLPRLEDFGIVRNPRLLAGGEARARRRLAQFKTRLGNYDKTRDAMGEEGTSRLSADLKFGVLSVRRVYQDVAGMVDGVSKDRFLTQLLWREFAYACIWDRPDLLFGPFRTKFEGFPYSKDERLFVAWVNGKTGYPIVDAAARQLLEEGYVHNRARMISASFLTKHLLVDYRKGEAHYLKYLTDGDWALNNMGWQWSAGCGVDAQPYFRVFNPIAQGEKFDQAGAYVRKYLPELAQLPNKFIHAPWTAPTSVLKQAGVRLDHDYPAPIVDHSTARKRFLALAHQHLKDGS